MKQSTAFIFRGVVHGYIYQVTHSDRLEAFRMAQRFFEGEEFEVEWEEPVVPISRDDLFPTWRKRSTHYA